MESWRVIDHKREVKRRSAVSPRWSVAAGSVSEARLLPQTRSLPFDEPFPIHAGLVAFSRRHRRPGTARRSWLWNLRSRIQ